MATGYSILLFDTHKTTRNGYIIRTIRNALGRHDKVKEVTLGHYGNACELAQLKRPDILIAFGGSGGDEAILDRLVRLCGFSVLWTTEDPYEVATNTQLAQRFDLVFSNDASCVEAYGVRGSHLALAACRDLHKLHPIEDDQDFLYDVLFVGSAWPNRVKQIRDIIRLVGPDLKYKVGLPTNPYLPEPKLGDRHQITDWRAPVDQFIHLANRSRITLGLTRVFSSDSTSKAQGSTPPPRIFEVAAAGAFQLVEDLSGELGNYFKLGKELVACRNADEFAEGIRYYLSHPAERLRITKAAQARCLRDHTYDSRVSTIMEKVDVRFGKSALNPPSAPKGKRKKRILHLTHNVKSRGHFGGVELYQHNLCGALNEYESFFLYPDQKGERNLLVLERISGVRTEYEVDPIASPLILHNPSHELALQRILFEHDIDLVHIQHLIGHVASLPIIANALGVPTVLTLHDYYTICSKFTLLGYDGRFCNVANPDTVKCDICLTASDNHPAGSQARRRNFFSYILDAVQIILANTESSKNLLEAVYPQIASDKVRVASMMFNEHLFDTDGEAIFGRDHGRTEECGGQRGRTKDLKVVVLGNFTREKGADLLVRIFNLMRSESIHFTILGRVDHPYSEILPALALPQVEIINGFRQEELAHHLTQADVSIHFSIWPETFCITLSEAWISGLTPIVADIGALGERVDHGVNGFKVTLDNPSELVTILRRLIADRDLITRTRNGVVESDYRTSEKHLDAVRQVYTDLIAARPLLHAEEGKKQRFPHGLTLNDCGIFVNSPNWASPVIVSDDKPPTIASPMVDESHIVMPRLTCPLIGKSRKVKTDQASELKFAIDYFCGYHFTSKQDSQSLRVERHEPIALTGWALNSVDMKMPADLHIKLSGSVDRYLELTRLDRSDVKNAFPALENAQVGFRVVADSSELPDGVYEVEFLFSYAGGIRTIPTGISMTFGLAAEPNITSVGSNEIPPISDDVSDAQESNLSKADDSPTSPRSDIPTDGSSRKYDFCIDALGNMEGEPLNDQVRNVSSDRPIFVQGWAVNLNNPVMPKEIQLRLQCDDAEVSVAAQRMERLDVAAALNNPVFVHSGFKAMFPADTVRSGSYDLTIIHKSNMEVIELETGIVLLVDTDAVAVIDVKRSVSWKSVLRKVNKTIGL